MAADPVGLARFCTKCFWSEVIPHPILGDREMIAVCGNPKQGVNPVDGSVRKQELRVHRMMRALPMYCGVSATWWEPKKPPLDTAPGLCDTVVSPPEGSSGIQR